VNLVVWIVTALLAAMFLMAGAMKLVKSKAQLLESPSMVWAEDFSPGVLKLIGAAEVAGAAGLILPGAFDVATWLVPTAAIGLAALMLGAVATHTRRREYPNIGINLVLLALAVFVAIERIGPERLH
jgi:uncharacterized membrane protein YphA (DoxX/SURF4 family)